MIRRTCSLLRTTALLACLVPFTGAGAQARARRPPLAAADVDDIVTLERIEDRREFDAAVLQRIAASRHPEVRRRTALAIARLYDSRGRSLLGAMRAEPDTAILATVAWATGQLVDTSAVPWLDSLLQNPRTPVTVATEAAGAFGKIRTATTRADLARYLAGAPRSPKTAPVVAEALLSIGRHAERGDIGPVAKWTTSPDAELRWRAAWALIRPRDPAAIPTLLTLARDRSADVRSWAMRSLTAARADSSGVGAHVTLSILIAALRDPDRRVRTEAVRALGSYDDAVSMVQLTLLLADEDPWIAVTAAQSLGTRASRARGAIAQLGTAATAASSPWIRAAAIEALPNISPAAALPVASAAAGDTAWVVRHAAASVLAGIGADAHDALVRLSTDRDPGIRALALQSLFTADDSTPDLAQRRAARVSAFASNDPVLRLAAVASMSSWADSIDIPALLNAFSVAAKDTSPAAAEATLETLADIEARGGNAARAFFARFRAAPSDIAYGLAGRAFGMKTIEAWGAGRPVHTLRTDADYRRIVEALVVPAYNGTAAPRLRWETTRGDVDTELNTLDAPLASDYLLALTSQGAMRNVRFDRVIPDFVAQQKEVLLAEPLQRDEISRGRLVRGNLSWGTNIGNSNHFPRLRGPGSSYDTGPAVYTFAHTPQPHNEGDFTALGRVIKGMDTVDQMQLGDVVKSVRILKPGER